MRRLILCTIVVLAMCPPGAFASSASAQALAMPDFDAIGTFTTGNGAASLPNAVSYGVAGVYVTRSTFVDPTTPVSQGQGWADGFNLPGASGEVDALAVGPDGLLYVGGRFTTAGKEVVRSIAAYDRSTSSWQSLGSGMDGDHPEVRALAVGPDGSLYVGGAFTGAGGVPANHVARWDGMLWHPLANGMDSEINALAFGLDGSLYAGGVFLSAGGVAANHIARWDGTAWHPLGSGMNDAVHVLAVGPDESLYAGGVFLSAGGVAANHIARWDGTAWHLLGSGMNDAVRALAVGSDGALYAGGEFSNAGGTEVSYVAHWDGTTWRPLGTGMSYHVLVLATGRDGSLYAGGPFLTAGGTPSHRISRWDGVQWQPLDDGMTAEGYAYVSALAFGVDERLYAGGKFVDAGGAVAINIARWDGLASAWESINPGSGMNGGHVHALTAGPAGTVYAGGVFTTAGGVLANRIAQWDQAMQSWRSLGDGIAGGDYPIVQALATAPDGSLFVGGWFLTAGGSHATSIARWDGSRWHALNGLVTPGNMPPWISALAVGPDGALYVGGDFNTVSGAAANYIARWDGATWHPLGSGLNGQVHSLVFGGDGSLYVGGRFTIAGGWPANHIARWDGTTWHSLGTGVDDSSFSAVLTLAVGADGSIYAGGKFARAGGAPANGVARWDGARWHALGSGMNQDSTVYALAVGQDGSIYAGGNLANAGNVPVNSMARWNGSQWHPMGSGMQGDSPYVYALLTEPDGSLYAGGNFAIAGGVTSSYFARWDGLGPSAATIASLDAVSVQGQPWFIWIVAVLCALALGVRRALIYGRLRLQAKHAGLIDAGARETRCRGRPGLRIGCISLATTVSCGAAHICAVSLS